MKQRLGIALALLPDPDLLVLDEPTNGLDPQGIVEIRSLLMRLGARGKTAFVSSHLLAETQAACDSIVMIDHGGVIFAGSMTELLARNSPTIRAAAHNATDTARLIELAAAAGYPATRARDGDRRPREAPRPARARERARRAGPPRSRSGSAVPPRRPPLADIAQILAVPTGTVKSRLHRARRQLGTALHDEETDR